jgi:hypothetical protein
MPSYYYSKTDADYPNIVLAVVDRILQYIAGVLYPTETYSVIVNNVETGSKKRMLLTDMSPSMEMREAAKANQWSNVKFPFTAYTIGDMIQNDLKSNRYAASGGYYSRYIGHKVYATPRILELPMTTFYNSPNDYMHAFLLLPDDTNDKVIITAPVIVDGTTYTYPIELSIDVIKGSLAFEVEQQLRAGKIYDLTHNVKASFHTLSLDHKNNVTNIMYPVDTVELGLGSKYKYDNGIAQTKETVVIPAQPTISSTSPTDHAIDIDVDSSIIINFSTAMTEQTVEDALTVIPHVDADLLWNASSTQLVINPITQLASGTLYEVEIIDTAESGVQIVMADDYEFSFITE